MLPFAVISSGLQLPPKQQVGAIRSSSGKKMNLTAIFDVMRSKLFFFFEFSIKVRIVNLCVRFLIN